MLSKAKIKYIQSLKHSKSRTENNAFVIEGEKIVEEWLTTGSGVELVVCTNTWAEKNKIIVNKLPSNGFFVVEDHVLNSLSFLQTPNQVLAVVTIPLVQEPKCVGNWVIALDTIQDPGNMGTIIRIADWFGVKDIVCSVGCVDVYNHKVIQAAMGSHLRVNVCEKDLVSYLPSQNVPVFVAALGGENAYGIQFPDAGILVIGNESNGVSMGVKSIAHHCVTIPKKGGAESLNAAVSAGIFCALINR